MNTDIEIKDSKLCHSFESIVGAMTIDQKRETLAWLATDNEVVQSVVSHIVGDDDQGWSTGDDNLKQKILEKVESSLIISPKYQWSVLTDLRQKLKDIRSSEHIYWVLYHKIDKDVAQLVFSELRKLGVKSNYTTEKGDSDIAEIKAMIESAFDAMKEESK